MRQQSRLLLLAILAVICLLAFVIEGQVKILRRAIDDLVYDNWNHYLPCQQLPAESEVREALAEHSQVIHQIEQVNPGNVGVEIDSQTCPGKADLVIWYASHQNRQAIEAILAGDTYYGIPYRLQNR